MKTFEYTIKDELGIHVRPAGLLAKEGKKFSSKITLTAKGKTVEITKLMALMGLGVKTGETVKIEITGDDEDAAYDAIKLFFDTTL
ncbi:MAG: HPr family phosphocarrier protein [Clostridia bacterium]